MMKLSCDCFTRWLPLAAACLLTPSAGAETRTFVENGKAQSVKTVGREWNAAAAAMPEARYLECAGKDNFLYAKAALGKGDFHIRARLSLNALDHTAASFVMDDNHFGFDGGGERMFVEGPEFGKSRYVGDAAKHVTHGKPFLFEVVRTGGRLAFQIDGKEVWQTEYKKPVSKFGLRPWRSTMCVYAFSAEGDVGDPVPESTMPPAYTIPTLDLSRETRRQVTIDREAGQYLGHPTTVLLEDNQTMIVVYPKGHGKGAIVMKRSTDGGLTWSERLPTPTSWATSQEVPTLYRVADRQGKKRLIMFSGLYPIRLAHSEDDGATWSELEPIGDYGGIVATSDLVRLKDGRLLTLFHDDGRFARKDGKRTGKFKNYQILSDDGGLTWGAPRVIAEHPAAHLCEPGIVRSPDGKQLAILFRENSRRYNGFAIFSDDEGATWSEPRELPAALTGDRHKARYDADGRLVIVFRDTARVSPTQGDFVAWVGTYEDIVRGREGQYRVRLLDNHHSWDCGYPGLERLPDGTFIATTYGHWTPGEQPYVVSARFTLADVDARAKQLPRKTPVYVSGEGGYHTYRIPAVIAAKSGALLAFCEGRKGGRGDAGDIDLLLKRSTDGGRSWSKQQVVWDDAGNTCGNPCPVVDRDTGTIWLLLTWNRGDDRESQIIAQTSKDTRRVFVTHSTDDGQTWAKPREITTDTKKPDWTWYATGPCTGIQLTRGANQGRLLIPCDHIEAKTKKYFSHVIYSGDAGQTWRLGGSSPTDQLNECQAAELADGRIVLNMRNYRRSSKTRGVTVSADGGMTWSPVRHDATLIEPICQASLISIDAPGGKRRLLFSNPASTDQRIDMTVRLSDDGGETWAVSRLLHAGPAAYSGMIALPDDELGCLYECGEKQAYETITFARFPLTWLTGLKE